MKKNSLALLVCSIFLGMFIIIQFRSVEQLTESRIPSEQAKELESKLENLKDNKKTLLKELGALDNTIEEYKNTETENDMDTRKIKNDIDKYKVLVGSTNVTGPGVIIKLDNSELYKYYDRLNIYVDYLLIIINKLNASGSEAICINDERIVSSTEIAYIQNEDRLEINTKNMSPPFEIKSIGNPDRLESTLNLKYGLV